MAAGAVALAGLLAAGCAEEGGEAAAPRLAAWSFPADVAIPEVDAAAPKPPERAPRDAGRADRGAADRGGPQIEGGFELESTEPGAASDGEVSPGAPSDAEIRAQLEELYGEGAVDSATGPGLSRKVTLHGGLATAPPDAPAAVQRIVAAANQVAKLPYVYGGGHGRAEGLFVDTAYDCSGSISFALANAGLMDRPMTSGEMMSWGEPGEGEWVTIYANAGHAFMVVGGARFDTVGLRETGSRWQKPFRTISGFTAVHPPGL